MTDESIDRKPDGGPAFPHIMARGHKDYAAGATLRDLFAAHLAGAEVASAGANYEAAQALSVAANLAGQTIEERIACNAYRVADAMLKERDR